MVVVADPTNTWSVGRIAIPSGWPHWEHFSGGGDIWSDMLTILQPCFHRDANRVSVSKPADSTRSRADQERLQSVWRSQSNVLYYLWQIYSLYLPLIWIHAIIVNQITHKEEFDNTYFYDCFLDFQHNMWNRPGYFNHKSNQKNLFSTLSSG